MAKSTDAQKEYKLGEGGKLYVLVICSLLLAVNFMDRQVFAAVVEPMKADLGLSDGSVGVLGTIFLLSTAIFTFPIAYLIDRWSRRKAIGIMAIAWSAFTLLTGFAWNFWSLLIPRTFVGVGEAGFTPGGAALVGAAYSKKARGIAMGIFNMTTALGLALGSLIGGIIAKQYGWQAPFFIFAIPGVILGILAFFMKDYQTAQKTQPGEKVTFIRTVSTLSKIPTLVWIFFGYGLAQITLQSVLFWLPAFVGRAWQVDVQAANAVIVPIAMVAIIASPTGGYLADLWFKKNPKGRIYVPAIALILAPIFLVAALFLQLKGPIGMTLIIIFGFLFVMAVPTTMAIIQDVAPAAQKGTAWGAIILGFYGIGGWSPYLVGSISDALGQDAQALGTALTIAGMGAVLGALFFFMASRSYVADMDKIKHEQIMAEK